MARVRSMLPSGAIVEVRFEGARMQRAFLAVSSYDGRKLLSRQYEFV